jgi:hypothetical protein
MSSLIFKSNVLFVGAVTQEDGRFVTDLGSYPESIYPGAYVVEVEPPHEGKWVYVDGQFIDLAPSMAQERLEALAALAPDLDAALVKHFDAAAAQKLYDSRITCVMRAGYAGPYQAEAIAFATWMDDCTASAYQQLQEYESHDKPARKAVQAIIDTLPAMDWPDQAE